MYINVVDRAFNVQVHFVRKVVFVLPFREEDDKLFGPASTWDTGSTGTHGNDPSYILSSVVRHTDKFIDEYLRVNESACK